MSFPELRGRRAIIMVRCSTNDQPQSIEDQLAACRDFAGTNRIDVVDDVRYEGVSASVVANLDAIAGSMIARKRKHDSFDCVLVYDFSRFRRCGARHAAKIKWELEQAGIDVITVMGYQSPNAFSEVAESFSAAQAHEQARSIAGSSARGAQSALEDGKRTHCTKPPYGVNRLLLSESGEELFILQNEVDGTQLRLNPKTGEVLERYPRRVGKASGHYRKSAGQQVVLSMSKWFAGSSASDKSTGWAIKASPRPSTMMESPVRRGGAGTRKQSRTLSTTRCISGEDWRTHDHARFTSSDRAVCPRMSQRTDGAGRASD